MLRPGRIVLRPTGQISLLSMGVIDEISWLKWDNIRILPGLGGDIGIYHPSAADITRGRSPRVISAARG